MRKIDLIPLAEMVDLQFFSKNKNLRICKVLLTAEKIPHPSVITPESSQLAWPKRPSFCDFNSNLVVDKSSETCDLQ